jgi:hypothetical protein
MAHGAPSTPRAIRRLLPLLLALCAHPRVAAAQLRTLPLVPTVHPGGTALGAELGVPDVEPAGPSWVGSVAWRGGRVGAVASAGRVEAARPSGAAALRVEAVLLRAREHPFEVLAFAGAGADRAARDDETSWRIPIGASVGFRLPTPWLALRAALAPRVHFEAGADASSAPGLGAALEATVWRHVRLRVASDVVLRDGADGAGDDEWTLGFGVTYTFNAGE